MWAAEWVDETSEGEEVEGVHGEGMFKRQGKWGSRGGEVEGGEVEGGEEVGGEVEGVHGEIEVREGG